MGTKYKIYSDGIGDASDFESPFDSNQIGMNNFYSDGWTFSGTHSIYERSDIHADDINIIGEELAITSTMSGSILNNSNIIIEKNRYTVVELDVMSYSVGTNSTWYQGPNYPGASMSSTSNMGNIVPIPILNFNNINQFEFPISIFGGPTTYYYFSMIFLPINQNINHLLTPNKKKYEYFFNKPSLSMKLLGADDIGITTGGDYSSRVIIDNLKYYEVDMIPFFQYFIDSNIYNGVSTPWQGIAPTIDITNSYFTFIDNISVPAINLNNLNQ